MSQAIGVPLSLAKRTFQGILEISWGWRFELHRFACSWVMEAEQISVEAEAMDWVVAIAVLDVTANRVVHVGRMYANLILTACLKLEFHERMMFAAPQCSEMCDGKLTAIIHWRRVGEVRLIVLQPRGYRAIVLFHDATEQGYIAAVIDDVVPVVLKDLLGLNVLCVDHQATCVAVKTMNHMRTAVLTTLHEVIVEYSLHVQRLMTGCHREDADVLLHDNEPTVFIDYLHIARLKDVLRTLLLAYGYGLAFP